MTPKQEAALQESEIVLSRESFLMMGQRIAELEAELMEQARVNGMGSEREAKLMARVERLEQALAEAVIAERERVIQILDGIDRTEFDEPDGWWETSSGASFGAEILRHIGGGK